jgi:hypothetical protein
VSAPRSLPFDRDLGNAAHQFVLPVDEVDVRGLAEARARGTSKALVAWAERRSGHVRRAADPRILLQVFDEMVFQLEAAGVASVTALHALRRTRDAEIGPHSGLAIARWIERLRGLAVVRAPAVFLDYEIAVPPLRRSGDPAVEAGIRWDEPKLDLTPRSVDELMGLALRACVAWDIGVLGFGGVASEAGVDAVRLARPEDVESALFPAGDVARSFGLGPGESVGAAGFVPNEALLAWAERLTALPDRLPIDVSHAKAREVVRRWQIGKGRAPRWFLDHEEHQSPDAVPLLAITLRAQWADAWAERRVALASRLRELAPFGFGMLVCEGRYDAP